ncbi:hypothetical protein [uncultured Eubacterium sp.]|uniref:hypothetical protein n=1 Tax=uncultured Eubacterium sp. TaxID=165185 RepID=UPI0025E29A13|nr:hypothetical protein [uncultured Eubacterium sp.]
MSDVLIIKCRRAVRPERLRELRRDVLAQKETGVIVLPSCVDAVVVPDDIKIVIDDDDKEESEETL